MPAKPRDHNYKIVQLRIIPFRCHLMLNYASIPNKLGSFHLIKQPVIFYYLSLICGICFSSSDFKILVLCIFIINFYISGSRSKPIFLNPTFT